MSDEDDLLDLDLETSHDQNNQINESQTNDGLYPAFQTLDDAANDENAPMLGKLSPNTSPRIDNIQSNDQINITINGSTSNINSTTNNDTTKKDPTTAKCWNIEYYQPYFDVDTKQLLIRLKKSILPTTQFFDPDFPDERPDLYGPFWIVSTLAFLMAAMGNLARYINRETNTQSEWDSDIKKISEAATCLYSVSLLAPAFLWFLFRNWNEPKGLIELISLYGYSLFPFVPACILCVVPWNLVEWAVVLTAMAISIAFLVKNLFTPLLEEKKSKPGYYVLGTIGIVQFAISLALKMYFFKY